MESEHCCLTTLRICLNDLGQHENGESHPGIDRLSEALQSPTCQLTNLFLVGCMVSSASGKALAAALQSPHCRLTTLDVSANRLCNEGGGAI
eukprot:SAG11_NODE_13374_length_658_cov_0.749553_2_plen_91_part_01